MGIVLGLDAGARSIGWALVFQDEEAGKGKIIDSGVRVFPAGVANYNTKKETSRTVKRRLKRGTRKTLARRKWRKRETLRWLDHHGFISLKENVSMSDLRRHLPDEFFTSDPFRLRFEGLSRKLEPLEFARVLFHLAQRRGFLSNRKVKGEGDGDDGKSLKIVFDSIQEVWEPLRNEYPTWGAFCHAVNIGEAGFPDEGVKDPWRIREKHAKRFWYIEEFEKIWEEQKIHYPEILTQDQKVRLRDEVIFFQRPLKSSAELVGYCTFEYEKREKRLPWGHPLAQRFRMLSDINSLQIGLAGAAADSMRPLLESERNVLKAKLGTSASNMKIERIRKLLKECQPEKQAVRTNYDDDNSVKHFKPLTTLYRLRKILGKSLEIEMAAEVFEIWNQDESDETISQELAKILPEADSNTLEKLLKFNPEPAYCRFGKTALQNIIPHLESGLVFSEACREAGYNHSDLDKLPTGSYSKLPSLDHFFRKYHPLKVNNPNVKRVLNEMRRLVNSIISHHGHPDTIRLELARELSLGTEARQDKSKRIAKGFDQNNNARYEIEKESLANGQKMDRISRKTLIRFRLWREQNQQCIYTGKPIGFAQLLNGDTDVDHIIPHSRRPEDAMSGLVLTFREVNEDKGNRTPWEWIGSDKVKWTTFREVVSSLRANHGYPFHKERKLLSKEHPELEGFVNSMLNDTAHATRLSQKYLSLICEDIQPVKGAIVSDLRKAMGIRPSFKADGLLANPYLGEIEDQIAREEFRGDKPRLDHRHHAVDAAVIACCTRSLIQKLTRNRKMRGKESGMSFMLPWPDFRRELEQAMSGIIVSHAFDHRIGGELHKETIYGKSKKQGKVTQRTKVMDLSINDIMGSLDGTGNYVLNREIREALLAELDKTIGLEEAEEIFHDKERRNKSLADLSKKIGLEDLASFHPLHMNGHPIRKVKLLVPLKNEIRLPRGSAKTSTMDHIVIFGKKDEKGSERHASAISTFNAAAGMVAECPKGFEKFLELRKGDVILRYGEGGFKEELLGDLEEIAKNTPAVLAPHLYVVKVMGREPVIVKCRSLWIAKESIKLERGKTSKRHGYYQANYNTIKALKVSVDPSGFITKIHWP